MARVCSVLGVLAVSAFSLNLNAETQRHQLPQIVEVAAESAEGKQAAKDNKADRARRAMQRLKERTFNAFLKSYVQPPGWELEVGGTLLKPVESDFDNRADLGIGLVAGVRKGFWNGRVVLSHSFEYDVYFSGVNRVAFGGQLNSPFIRLEGYGGIKYRILSINPFDNFISSDEVISSTIPVVGLDISLPGLRNYMTGRIEFWPGSKRFLLIGILVKLSL